MHKKDHVNKKKNEKCGIRKWEKGIEVSTGAEPPELSPVPPVPFDTEARAYSFIRAWQQTASTRI